MALSGSVGEFKVRAMELEDDEQTHAFLRCERERVRSRTNDRS